MTTLINSAIFDVDATDLLNHNPLTYTMTSIPTTTSFKIDASKSGYSVYGRCPPIPRTFITHN